MKKYICLRDDDTNFFTTVDELREGYGKIWGKHPITLATVPFAHGSERKIMDYDLEKNKFQLLREWEIQATAEELTEYHKAHPIGDNKELVAELRRQIAAGKIEIAQHGVFHRFNERGAELYGDEMAFGALRDGKEYLEKVFQTQIKTFIAPANTIDRCCARYVKDLGLHLFCGAIRFKNGWDKLLSIVEDPLSGKEKFIQTVQKKHKPLLRRCGQYMFGSVTYNVFDDYEDVKKQVLERLESCGYAALGTHYRLLANLDYRSNYQRLVSELSQLPDVEFVTAEQYYKSMKEKYYE